MNIVHMYVPMYVCMYCRWYLLRKRSLFFLNVEKKNVFTNLSKLELGRLAVRWAADTRAIVGIVVFVVALPTLFATATGSL